jgi:hypothetical protein
VAGPPHCATVSHNPTHNPASSLLRRSADAWELNWCGDVFAGPAEPAAASAAGDPLEPPSRSAAHSPTALRTPARPQPGGTAAGSPLTHGLRGQRLVSLPPIGAPAYGRRATAGSPAPYADVGRRYMDDDSEDPDGGEWKPPPSQPVERPAGAGGDGGSGGGGDPLRRAPARAVYESRAAMRTAGSAAAAAGGGGGGGKLANGGAAPFLSVRAMLNQRN